MRVFKNSHLQYSHLTFKSRSPIKRKTRKKLKVKPYTKHTDQIIIDKANEAVYCHPFVYKKIKERYEYEDLTRRSFIPVHYGIRPYPILDFGVV